MSLLAEKPLKLTSADIRSAIKAAYPGEAYAVLFEVADATGARHSRWADAVVMSCWPSRGLTLTGMEIKVSRNDWQREIENPKKAEAIAQYCDFWTLVTAPGVVRDIGEIPPAWGWMECVDGKRLVTRQKATKTDAKPYTREFMASLLRNAGKVDESLVKQKVDAAVAAMRENIDKEIKRGIDQRTKDARELDERVTAFQEVTGIDLTVSRSWDFLMGDGQRIGKLINSIRENGFDGYKSLASLESDLRDMALKIGLLREEMGLPAPGASPRL